MILDINQMVEKLKSEMPKGLSEIEIAKYIYIELGKIKSYDEKYFFGNSKTRNKIYRLAKNTPNIINETMKKKKIVCVSLAYLYRELLKRFGIKAHVLYPDIEGEHACVVINLTNGTSIKTDLQLDLPNIQARMRTRHFGKKYSNEDTEPYSEISDEENLRIDKKINYIKDEKDYRDEDINNLKKICQGKSPREISQIIVNDDSVNDLPRDMGYVDRSTYYIGLFRSFMPRENFDIVHCYRYDGNKDDSGIESKRYKMILSIYDKKNAQNIYSFSNKKNKFVQIKPEILKDVAFFENRERDLPTTTYWSRTVNYSGARKMMHYIKENEKRNQNETNR